LSADIPVKSFININSEISVLKSKVGGFRPLASR